MTPSPENHQTNTRYKKVMEENKNGANEVREAINLK